MKREMSYRDKMILLGLSVVVILLAGFFALVKPAYDKWQKSKVTYTATKTEWDGIDQKRKSIDPLKKTITDTANEAAKVAEIFENTAFVTANQTMTNERTYYEIDQYLQPAIDECTLKVRNFELGDVSAVPITYYVYTPDVLTYSLLEAADINGNYAAEIAGMMEKNVILSEREVVDVMCEEVGLAVSGTKASVMNFLNKIESDNNAVLIKTVDIANYEFTDGLEIEGPDGTMIPNPDPNAEGFSEVTMTIGFYNAKAVDEPDLGN